MSDKQYYPGSYYQPLFDLMHQEHGLTLLESQMADIIHLVNKHYVSQVNPSTGMPPLDHPILTDEDVRAWEESETSRPPAGFEKIPFDPNRLKKMDGHEERAEKSWEEIQKRLAQQPAVKGAVWFYCWKDDPKSNGQYFVETNMGRKVVANYNKEAKWCPQDFPMWTDGERPYKFQDDESPTAAGERDEVTKLKNELQYAQDGFKIKSEQVGYWHQAYSVLKHVLEELRKGANSADVAIIDEALSREIKATAGGDGKPTSWGPDEYPDLSSCTAEQKHDTIFGLIQIAAREIMRMFYAFGLKTHIECKVVNEPTNETFEFSFVKVGAGDGKEGQELLDWIYENDIIRTEDGTWEKWDNGKALYRLFASGIAELYDIFKQQNK